MFLPEAGAFDDIPALISEPNIAPPIVTGGPPPVPPVSDSNPLGEVRISEVTSPPLASRSVTGRPLRQVDGTVRLTARGTVYAQAGVVAGLALLAFLAGLLIGRATRPPVEVTAASISTEPVALEGHVLYALSPGESLPDAGSTVIALPPDKKPDRKIAARGLRAGDEDDLDAAADALRAIGAAVARADDAGQFQLLVPRPGNYSLVIISNHANRPDGLTVALADAEELSQYFSSPAELIGQKRYAVSVRKLSGAPPPMIHEFGPTDKK